MWNLKKVKACLIASTILILPHQGFCLTGLAEVAIVQGGTEVIKMLLNSEDKDSKSVEKAQININLSENDFTAIEKELGEDKRDQFLDDLSKEVAASILRLRYVRTDTPKTREIVNDYEVFKNKN
jgi:hypothetical protein